MDILETGAEKIAIMDQLHDIIHEIIVGGQIVGIEECKNRRQEAGMRIECASAEVARKLFG